MTEEDALKRALERERARRRSAELLLEEKSRELFESFEALEQAHDALKKNQKQLIRSEKMASLGVMSAGIAHEINNPVGFALSNIGLLEDNFPLIEKAMVTGRRLIAESAGSGHLAVQIADFESQCEDDEIEYLIGDIPDLLKETGDGLRRIKNIVQSLQSFTHSDGSTREPMSLNESLKNALTLAQMNLKPTVKVVEDFNELPEICASRSGMRRVFINVLFNAVDAIAAVDRSDHVLSVETRLREGEIFVVIADTGCGIPDSDQEKIFTPFFTRKDVGEGTGLGLSVSLGIVEEHDGRITVESTEGAGSRFEIVLPVASLQVV